MSKKKTKTQSKESVEKDGSNSKPKEVVEKAKKADQNSKSIEVLPVACTSYSISHVGHIEWKLEKLTIVSGTVTAKETVAQDIKEICMRRLKIELFRSI